MYRFKIENIMMEKQIKGLGFEMTKQYRHDQFNTNRYRKGALEIEFTYEKDKLVTCDLTVSEIYCKAITFKEIKALALIF